MLIETGEVLQYLNRLIGQHAVIDELVARGLIPKKLEDEWLNATWAIMSHLHESLKC